MRPVSWPWAILLCRFSDVPAVPQPPDYYEDLYTRNGTGGVADYWREVTFGGLDLTGSRVFGWLTMSHPKSDVLTLTFPAQRGTLIQWGRDAAAAAGIDLTPFRSVLVVQNFGVDHGAAGGDVVVVHSNPNLCEFGFICHEMGHGFFGPQHSMSANPDTAYGDGWDVMSFATTTFQFPITFKDSAGAGTVGLNARNLLALGTLEPSRIWQPAAPDFSTSHVLDPLNQPPLGNHGPLVLRFPPAVTRPSRPDGSTWTVELRSKAGYDQSIPENAVLVHQIRTNTLSYLQPTMGSRFTSGQQFAIPAPEIYLKVEMITANPVTGRVRVWDLPEGCLRKEDSKPQVYLIEGGRKRWVTSPAVLFALGRTWADVRSVPDGALSNIPDGPDVVLLQTAVTPHPVPTNRLVTVTFTARAVGSGTAVPGRVLVDGVDIGPTGAALQHRFTVRRVREPGSNPPTFEVIAPTVTISAAGFPEADVDCGFPSTP